MFKHFKAEMPYDGKVKPFKIFGGLYFVGTIQESSHLIDTGDGLILIDIGNKDNMYLVLNSIYELGFKPSDIKYIFFTHWHGDHTGAAPLMKDLSGATTLLGRDDVEKAAKYFVPDVLLDDGDTLELGNTKIEFMATPGHTKGVMSPFFNVTENGVTYRVGMFGGAGANTLVPEKYDFEGCREAYRNSIQRLRKEKVDIFIGNHTWNNDTVNKGKLLLETGENKFIDPELFGKFLDHCENRLNSIIEKESPFLK